MDFTEEGGQKILNFTINTKWTLAVSETQSSAKWCTVSQSEGAAGTHNVVVTVAPNAGDEDRNVVLLLKTADGSMTKTVIVNQKQARSITLTTDRFEVDAKGGRIDIEVRSNVEYSIEIPELYRSWISETSTSRAMTTNTLSFNIAESKEYDKREGEIIITSGDIQEKVKIFQSGSAILVLTQNEYTIGCQGGTIEVNLSSNFEVEVDMPNVSWLKDANKSRAVSSHTLYYEVTENTSYDDREAVIVFKDSNGEHKESVCIRQRSKDAILLTNSFVEIPQEGGNFSAEVNSNVDYAISIPSPCNKWISKASSNSQSRALTKTFPTFKVNSSEEYSKREGEIHFSYGEITETLKVYQSGGAVLVLTQDKYNLDGGATTISVQLKSNIDYSINISDDWITEVATRAVSNSTKQFNIAINKTGKNRTGKITFKSSDGSKSADVIINQATLVEAKNLSIVFTNTSGTMGDGLYIGKTYGLTAVASPSNAAAAYEWEVEDTRIATMSGSGNSITLKTKDFGQTRVVVTEKNSGISASYDFATCVTDFRFTEDTGEKSYGYPAITLVVGEKYKLNYTHTPSYATKIFSDLSAFQFKEIEPSMNAYLPVEKSTIVDIDADGNMTGLRTGSTIINCNNHPYVFKSSNTNDGIFVKVISEYFESEYNDDFTYANTIKPGQKMKFYLSSSSDVDIFKFTRPTEKYFYVKLTYYGEGNYASGSRIISYDLFNNNKEMFGAGNLSFEAKDGGVQTQYRWLNTTTGYIKFYMKSENVNYFMPQGFFTIEFVTEDDPDVQKSKRRARK